MKKVASFFLFSLCCGFISSNTFFVHAQDANTAPLQTSISMDIYKKIREGSMQVENAYTEKRLEGIGAQLNASVCPRAAKNCFNETKNFTVQDINLILSNHTTAIMPYLSDDFKKTLTTNDITTIMHDGRNFLANFLQESRNNIKDIEQVGSIGVYTDGSLSNSPFDLMYDLEQIKNVILTNKKKYGGLKNTTTEEFSNSITGGKTAKRGVQGDGSVQDDCKGSFCIKVGSEGVDDSGVGSSAKKPDTIQGVINTVYDIVKNYSGKSFVQSTMTKNFFESSLPGLKFPSLANLSVQVTTSPVSIFKKKQTTTDDSTENKEKERGEFANEALLTSTFDEFWISYKKQNSLQDFENNVKKSCNPDANSEGLTTPEIIAKCEKNKEILGYASLKDNTSQINATLQKKYYSNFEKEMMEFENIASSLQEGISYLVQMTAKTYDTKCQN